MTEGYHRKNAGALVTLVNQIAGGPWTEYAKCGDDSDRWFPTRKDQDSVGEAIAICRTCPVRWQCLEEAESRGERWGIWGGQFFGSELSKANPVADALRDSGRTHCKRGHALTVDTAYIKNGKSLACRQCQLIHDRNARARKAEAS